MSVVIFDGKSIFGSGPVRVVIEPRGAVLIPRLRLNQPVSGSVLIGPAELVVQIRGRLVASDEATLRGLEQEALATLTNPPTVSRLVEPSGVQHDDMTYVSFERRGWGVAGSARDGLGEVGTIDRGREVSLAFVARFVRVNAL